MAVTLYPSYDPPFNSVKLHDHWDKCFDVNGRLGGFDATEINGVLFLGSGAYITRGCVVQLDATTIPLIDPPEQPYYLVGSFDEFRDVPILEFSNSATGNSAPLVKKENGTWTQVDSVTLYDLAAKKDAHKTTLYKHLPENFYQAMINANEPSVNNPFINHVDNTNPIQVKLFDSSRLLAASTMGTRNLDTIKSHDTTNFVTDILKNAECNYISYGLNNLIECGIVGSNFDPTSNAFIQQNGITGAPLMNNTQAYDVGDLAEVRCSVSGSYLVPSIETNYMTSCEIDQPDITQCTAGHQIYVRHHWWHWWWHHDPWYYYDPYHNYNYWGYQTRFGKPYNHYWWWGWGHWWRWYHYHIHWEHNWVPFSHACHEITITKGSGLATFTRTSPTYLPLVSNGRYVHQHLMVPSDPNLLWWEMELTDTSGRKASNRLLYENMKPNLWSELAVDVSGIQANNGIKSIKHTFSYKDNVASGTMYLGMLSSCPTVKTITLLDTTSDVTTAEVSLLMDHRSSPEKILKYNDPIVELSKDAGTTWYIIPQDATTDISTFTKLGATTKLQLRVNLFNAGGDFNITKPQWPRITTTYFMDADPISDVALSMHGYNSGKVYSNIMDVYYRNNDTYVTNTTAASARRWSSGCFVNNKFHTIGGSGEQQVYQRYEHRHWFHHHVWYAWVTYPTWFSDHYSYSHANKTSAIRTPYPGTIAGSSMVAIDDKSIHANKGVLNGAHTGDSAQFNDFNSSWTDRANSPTGHYSKGCQIGNRHITGSTAYANNRSAEMYVSSTNSWSYKNTGFWTSPWQVFTGLKAGPVLSFLQSTAGICGPTANAQYFIYNIWNEKAKWVAGCPTNVTGGRAVYHDDAVSFGPYNLQGPDGNFNAFSQAHMIHYPYLSTRLYGFSLKYN